jgi:hypothetical protein
MRNDAGEHPLEIFVGRNLHVSALYVGIETLMMETSQLAGPDRSTLGLGMHSTLV